VFPANNATAKHAEMANLIARTPAKVVVEVGNVGRTHAGFIGANNPYYRENRYPGKYLRKIPMLSFGLPSEPGTSDSIPVAKPVPVAIGRELNQLCV
jgi:hypothetical protein